MTVGNMILCPECGHMNIEGVDECENCLSDLRGIDVPPTAQPETQSRLSTLLADVQLGPATTIDIASSIGDALALMRMRKTEVLVVTADGRVAGMFTDRDVLTKVADGAMRQSDPLRSAMTPDPVVLRETDSISVAMNKMGAGGFRHIPLTRDGEVVSVVSAWDVLKWVMGQYFLND